MSNRIPQSIACALIAWLLCLATHAAAFAPSLDAPHAVTAGQAVQAALDAINSAAKTSAAAGVPARRNVELQGVGVSGNRIVINLGGGIIDYSVGSAEFEALLKRIQFAVDEAIGNELARAMRGVEYVMQIDGRPLSQFFAEETPAGMPGHAPPPKIAFAGRRVAINPGHGYYRNAAGAWVLQRDYFQGIVEDFVNAEMVMYLNDNLRAAGVIVRPVRNLDKNAGGGVSGFAKWQESAREHIRALGVPAFVWDSSTSDLNDDIRARPLYANWIDNFGFSTDLIVSLHNNGGGGTGTETLYDTDNGFGAESKKLADIVHAKIINAIRTRHNAGWVDRGVKGFAGSYGENRLATRPAILIEVAFMDRPTPDNAALRDENFKRLVAEAITEGLADYYAGVVDSAAPTVPQSVAARAFSDSGVQLTWLASTDNYDVPTYRVLRDGIVLGETGENDFVDASVVSGASYTYAVVALDRSGNASAPSAQANVTVPMPIAAVALAKRGGIDIDGDGRGEILLRAHDTQVANALLIGRLVNDQLVFSNLPDPGALFRLVATADFDGNGKSDLVFQNTLTPGEFGEVRVWPDFLPGSARRVREVKRVWDVQAAGDLDGDGFGDLVWRYVVSESPDTGVSYIWFTNGVEEPLVRKRGGAPLTWQLLGASDLNGDGAADMVYISPATAAAPSNVRVLMATAMRSCANLAVGTIPAGFKVQKLADFSGARRGDILIQNETSGAVGLIALNAVGLALPPFTADANDRNAACSPSALAVDAIPLTLPAVAADWRYYAAADLNGDGVTDIIWRRPDNTLTVWLMAARPLAPTVINNAGTVPLGYGVFQP